jgi:hypothetical protein
MNRSISLLNDLHGQIHTQSRTCRLGREEGLKYLPLGRVIHPVARIREKNI